MNEIKIVSDTISKKQLLEISKMMFGDLVKAVVDCEARIMAIGGELHADEEQVLLERGSHQSAVWGINLYPEKEGEDWIEFDSMINIRPSQGNRSRNVENPEIQKLIRSIVQERVE